MPDLLQLTLVGACNHVNLLSAEDALVCKFIKHFLQMILTVFLITLRAVLLIGVLVLDTVLINVTN